MLDWLGELNLEVTGPPVSMGVRKLGDRPWILIDEFFDEELLLKSELAKDESKEVFMAEENTENAGVSVLSLIRKSGVQLTDIRCDHPLERAGLSIQEDLCLMHRTSEGWVLKAASLCFPSRWQLREKIGKTLGNIHGPVEGYEVHLSQKVNNFFDRLGHEPVWRRNWFIHPDNNLYQPKRPLNGDPIIGFGEIGKELFVRSERQTLQLLDLPGWILFTIRVQRTSLRDLLTRRKEEFHTWILEGPDSHHDHKGLAVTQVEEIRKALISGTYH